MCLNGNMVPLKIALLLVTVLLPSVVGAENLPPENLYLDGGNSTTAVYLVSRSGARWRWLRCRFVTHGDPCRVCHAHLVVVHAGWQEATLSAALLLKKGLLSVQQHSLKKVK